MIVKPGETFSLNGATEPRDEAHGYVEAGIISEGHASRGVGGGVSQVATTLYNAAYFAGMADVTHKPHSFYISRYPPGREATVFEGAIDMKFRNDDPTGVMIQTAWTPTSLTVRLYGTKQLRRDVVDGPADEPDRADQGRDPRGPALRAQPGRARVHGDGHPDAARRQDRRGQDGEADHEVQPVTDRHLRVGVTASRARPEERRVFPIRHLAT